MTERQWFNRKLVDRVSLEWFITAFSARSISLKEFPNQRCCLAANVVIPVETSEIIGRNRSWSDRAEILRSSEIHHQGTLK